MNEAIHVQSLLVVAGFSIAGGIGHHLWIKSAISLRQWVGAVIISALMGAVTYLWLYNYVESHFKLMGLSIFSGAIGTTMFDLLVVAAVRKVKEQADV